MNEEEDNPIECKGISIEEGLILVDFDARTGHNHGTKFRMRQDALPKLYENASQV